MSDQSDTQDTSTPIDDRFYRLVNHEPVRCTFSEFALFMQDDAHRILAQDTVESIQISTVFCGINQNWGEGAPILFETMIFGLPEELQPQWHFATWDEAIQQHQQLLESLKAHGTAPLIADIRKKSEN